MTQRHEGRQRRRLTATEVDLGVVRQRALLVGTGVNARDVIEAEADLEELALLADTAGAEVGRDRVPAPRPPGLRDLRRQGQGRGARRDGGVARPRRHHLRRRALARAATQPGEAVQGRRRGPRRADPRHLRPARGRARRAWSRSSSRSCATGCRACAAGASSSPSRGVASAPAVPVRPSSRSTGGASRPRSRSSSATSKQLARTRATQRKSRNRRSLTTVALVGYTNAGKSTLLNRLTQAEVLVEDRLFSTLDPSTRRLRLPGGEMVLLSDTVGFVRRLPHQLVESFRSTLEEVASADLLVHLVDAGTARARAADRGGAVGAAARSVPRTVPEQLVFTKSDTVDAETVAQLRRVAPGLARGVRRAPATGVEDLPARHRRPAARARAGHRAAGALRPRRRAGRPAPRRRGARRGARGGRDPGAGPAAADGDAVATWTSSRRSPDSLAVVSEPAHRPRASSRRRTRTIGSTPCAGSPTRCPAASSTARSATRWTRSRRSRCTRSPAAAPTRHVVPAVDRHARSCGRAAAEWIDRRFGLDARPGRRDRVRRHQGARRVAAAPAAPAGPVARHRPVPGDLVPDLRDGRRARRPAGGAGPARRRVAARPQPGQRRGRRARALVLWTNDPGNPTAAVAGGAATDDAGRVGAGARRDRRGGRVLRGVHRRGDPAGDRAAERERRGARTALAVEALEHGGHARRLRRRRPRARPLPGRDPQARGAHRADPDPGRGRPPRSATTSTSSCSATGTSAAAR